MAEFIHTTNSEIEGPFLIDRSQLEALDHILNEEWARFEEEHKKTLHDAIEEEFSKERAHSWNKGKSDAELRASAKESLERSYQFRKERYCSITLRDGSIVCLPDFAAAFRERDLQDKEPSGFVTGMQSCEHTCSITLERRWTSLKVEVAPKGDHFVQQTFTVLKNWQDSVRPSLWQLWWHKFGSAAWFIWFLAMFVSLQLIVQRREAEVKNDYRQQTSALLTNGISADKQGKAIELLLANAYDIHPQKAGSKFPNWLLLLTFGGFAYCIALSIKPDVAIAIGRGVGKVRFWRKYSTFILITTPSFVFVTFYWPKIETIIKGFF